MITFKKRNNVDSIQKNYNIKKCFLPEIILTNERNGKTITHPKSITFGCVVLAPSSF
jgi:hypothetical protein